MYLVRPDDVRYALHEADSIAAIARAAGVTRSPYLDAMDASAGRAIVNWPVMNQDESAIEEQLASPPRSSAWLTPAPTPPRSWTPASRPTWPTGARCIARC